MNQNSTLLKSKIFSFIKPQNCWKTILTELHNRLKEVDCFISKIFVFSFNENSVTEFYSHVKHLDFFKEMKDYLQSDLILGMFIEGENVFQKVRLIIGETHEWSENSLRFKYAKDKTRNVLHASREEDSEREIDFVEKYLT